MTDLKDDKSSKIDVDSAFQLTRVYAKKKKIIGRGLGSGKGRTSTRGHKGYKARKGNGKNLGFEGGQMPLIKRLPKVGFSNAPHKIFFKIINLDMLERRYDQDEVVSLESLKEKKIIRNLSLSIKILGKGKLTKSLILDKGIYCSKSARDAFSKVL